jgi:hypothetical protein
MPYVRAAGVVLGAAAASVAVGCAGARLKAEPAAGVTLAGSWKLNRAASDDPQKVLERMRAEAVRRIHAAAVRRPDPRGGPGAVDEPPTEDAAARGVQRADPLRRSPMAQVLMTRIARGEFLTVRQGAGSFQLDYGASQRRFTPGEHSVVSAEGGVGDQVSGWQGHEYVIEVRPQLGPQITERYGLSGDGRHLVEKLHVAAAELSAVALTRVYDPTDERAPRQLPVSD